MMPGSMQQRYKNPYTTGNFGLEKGSICGRNQGKTMLPALYKSTPFNPETTLKYYRKVSQPTNAMSPATQLRYAKKSLCDGNSVFPKSVKTGNRAHRLPNVAMNKMGRALTRGTQQNTHDSP